MDLFYHVVGLEGSKDFKKTVAKKWQWSEIESALDLDEDTVSHLKRKTDKTLGSRFNIWGVPSGAEKIWKLMREEQAYLLLITSIAIHNSSILYGGKVSIVVPGHQWDLSERLWQSKTFPLICFFQTEHLATDWESFREAAGYLENYRPPALLYRLRPDRAQALAAGQGVPAYIRSIRVP